MESGEILAEHERWMRAALALGRRSMGRAAPNPAVGALVVRDGVVLGRGVTAPGGRPHAEPLALAEAGPGTRGATIYVTLEPCSHHGHTRPCTEAIIASDVARVVYALVDPDSRVAGRGLSRLRDAGIAVVGPVCAEEARRDHLGHILHVTRGRPSVTLKMAETADGFAAAAPGSPRLLITGPAANAAVHRLRSLHDAVMVGIGTALADDPQLTVRLPGSDSRPVRVVLDADLCLRDSAAMVQTLPADPLIMLTSDRADPKRAAALEERGVTVLRVPSTAKRLDLGASLMALGRQGLTRILCEGGPTLASALLTNGWADQIVTITAGHSLGAAGLPALDRQARQCLMDPVRYKPLEEVRLGPDRLRTYDRIEDLCSPDL